MRRSKAPSILQKRRMEEGGSIAQSEEELRFHHKSNSTSNSNKIGEFQTERIFKVVWRFVSTKKHKTWKGDGCLKVKPFTQNAVLRDETGEILAEGIISNLDELKVDTKIILEDKEFELLEEVTAGKDNRRITKDKDLVEISILSKKQRKELEVEKIGYPRDSNLSTPQFEGKNILSNNYKKMSKIPLDEVILCIHCSELQHDLFEQIFDYYEEQKNEPLFNGTQNIIDVLQHICTHPSLLNDENLQNNNLLCKILSNGLPESQEMGPFDSAKLEFIQQLLDHQQRQSSMMENYMILLLAQHEFSMNMLQGLCDFMSIPYVLINELNEEDLDECMNGYDNQSATITVGLMQIYPEEKENQLEVDLFHSVITRYSSKIQQIIIFEEVILIRQRLLEAISVYNLHEFGPLSVKIIVTAFTIEEILCHSEKNVLEDFNKDDLEEVFKVWKNRKIEYNKNSWRRIEQVEESDKEECCPIDKVCLRYIKKT